MMSSSSAAMAFAALLSPSNVQMRQAGRTGARRAGRRRAVGSSSTAPMAMLSGIGGSRGEQRRVGIGGGRGEPRREGRGPLLGAAGAAGVGAFFALFHRRRKQRWGAGCKCWRSKSRQSQAVAARAAGEDAAAASASASASAQPESDKEIEDRKPPSVIFFCIFLHLLGFTMNGPILPSLRDHFSLPASDTGLITSAFPLGVFAANFIFPALSDVVGRKPILVISYLGVGLGFCLQALAVRVGLPFRTFLALRTLSGAFAGASTVVKAYLADAATPSRLPKMMGYRESAATLAFIFGPTLGGWAIAATSLPAVILTEGLASVLAGVLVILMLPRASPQERSSGGGRKDERKAALICPIRWGSPWVPIITTMVIGCLYNFGQSFFDGYFSVLCNERFMLPAPRIGYLQTSVAVVVLLGSMRFYAPLVAKVGLVETASMGLVCIGAGLATTGASCDLKLTGLGLLLYGIGIPLFSPSVPTILTRCAPSDRRGLILGVDSSVNSAARILSPVLFGKLYGASASQAFGLAGLVVAGGAAVMMLEKYGLDRWRRR